MSSRRVGITLLWAVAGSLPGTMHAQGYPFSQRGSVTQTVAFTTISVVYGRPVARGRGLFGRARNPFARRGADYLFSIRPARQFGDANTLAYGERTGANQSAVSARCTVMNVASHEAEVATRGDAPHVPVELMRIRILQPSNST
jgi:hypothetical protein